MSQEKSTTGRRVWLMLILPAILIFIITTVVGIYYGVITQGNAIAIEQGITGALPYLLIVNHLILFFVLLRMMQKDGLTLREIWLGGKQQPIGREILIGILVAVPLTIFNQFVLLPGTEYLQRTLGDYVPVGKVASTFGAHFAVSFIAAGILAPIVEESIYRGYAMNRLGRRFSQPVTLLIVTIFFGFLHWSQGFWPMLYTMVAGAIFAGLMLWRRNLIGSSITHSMFNIVEMLFWLR